MNWTQRTPLAIFTFVDSWLMENHSRSHDAKWTLKTILKKKTRSRPAFTHEPIYRVHRKLNPNAFTDFPFLLKQSAKWAIVKP